MPPLPARFLSTHRQQALLRGRLRLRAAREARRHDGELAGPDVAAGVQEGVGLARRVALRAAAPGKVIVQPPVLERRVGERLLLHAQNRLVVQARHGLRADRHVGPALRGVVGKRRDARPALLGALVELEVQHGAATMAAEAHAVARAEELLGVLLLLRRGARRAHARRRLEVGARHRREPALHRGLGARDLRRRRRRQRLLVVRRAAARARGGVGGWDVGAHDDLPLLAALRGRRALRRALRSLTAFVGRGLQRVAIEGRRRRRSQCKTRRGGACCSRTTNHVHLCLSLTLDHGQKGFASAPGGAATSSSAATSSAAAERR